MALTLSGDDGVAGVNGSATTPAIQGTDTNTGLTFGTDTVNVVTGGSNRTTVDSSGRLLVGTTSSETFNGDQTKIQIKDTGASAGLSIHRSQNTNSPAFINLAMSRAGAVVSNNDPLGAIYFLGHDGTDINSMAASITAEVDNTPGSNDMPGRIVFATTADGASSPTERVRIDNFGAFKASNCQSSTRYLNTAQTFHELRTDDNDQWVAVLSHATGGNPYGLNVYYENKTPNNTYSEFIYCNDATAIRFTVRSNGGIVNYQSNDVNLCDEREKKNIESLDSTWDCLKHWDLKKFHYNEDADTDDKRYGVIAQQVAPHCPEVITNWVKQKAEDAVLDDDGNIVTEAKEEIVRMGVKEQQMYWMAIKALQEAQTRIEQLETRVAQLEGGAS